MRMFDAPVDAGRPPLVVVPIRPAEDDPMPHAVWPGWVWWYGENGHPRARSGDRVIRARNFTELLEKIRKAEEGKQGG